MDVQKIKRLNYTKGGKYKRTPEQIEAAKKNLIKVHLTKSAWTPEANEKRRQTRSRKGIKPSHPFPKGNQLGRLRKNTKWSDKQKQLSSMKHLGVSCHSEAFKKERAEKWKINNPMKNPEIQKKQKAAEIKTRRIKPEREKSIIELYIKESWAPSRIARKLKISKENILELLRSKNLIKKGKNFKEQLPILKKQKGWLNLEVIRLYTEKKWFASNISKKLNIERKVVYRILRRNKIKVKRRLKPMPDSEKKGLTNRMLINNPMKNKETVEKLRKTKSTGRKDRRKGTPPHRYQTNIPITPELEKEICELYSQGWSTIKLAERFKLDRFKTIKKILIKNKTPIRKRTDKIYHLENNFKKCKEVQDEETNNNITAPVAISN